MDGYRISEAARASGFSESALRYYEKRGVVVPDRTPTGYRSYGETEVESLRFVARAKRLGLSLSEITELLALIQDDECSPVQTRMRQLLSRQIEQAQRQMADLMAFTAQLQETVSRLDAHTPEGGCDDQCGCRADHHPAKSMSARSALVTGRSPADLSHRGAKTHTVKRKEPAK